MKRRYEAPAGREAVDTPLVDSFANGPLVFPILDEGAGAPVVLLHGFPQEPGSFDAVVPLLHRAGLRTLRPTQRGYAETARPARTADYRLTSLVSDVVALLDAARLERAHVVGHDWGGMVAWGLACSQPERVQSLTVLSTPHPAAFLRAMLTSSQALHSSYMLSFQPPGLAERLYGGAEQADRARGLLRSFGAPPEAIETGVALFADRDRLRAMLQWYRAIPLSIPAMARGRGVASACTVPTTYAWSTEDAALGRTAAEQTGAHVSGPYRFEVLPGLTHWLPEQAPEVVADLVLDRVGERPT